MKKICLFFLLLMFPILFGCTKENSAIPEGYHNKAEYYDTGFQDYADYCRYEYLSSQAHLFAEHNSYRLVQDSDFERISAYFSFFEQRLEAQGRKDILDFETQYITQGDYMYLLTATQPDPYYKFTLYYFDAESSTLFYFHNVS